MCVLPLDCRNGMSACILYKGETAFVVRRKAEGRRGGTQANQAMGVYVAYSRNSAIKQSVYIRYTL